MRSDQTRYQILFTEKTRKTENFTAAQKKAFDERVKQLRHEQVVFSTWDTRQNALSKLFAI